MLLTCGWYRNVVVSVVLQLWLLRGVLLQSTTWKNCSNERNICYEFNDEEKSQSDAEASCRRRNGQLLTILDRETQLYIQRMLGTSNTAYWTGGKLHFMRQWTWVNGVSYSGKFHVCTTAATAWASVYFFIYRLLINYCAGIWNLTNGQASWNC